MEQYWEWLCSIPGIYHNQQETLLKCFETPEQIWLASEAEWDHLESRGLGWITRVREFQKKYTPEQIRHDRYKKGIEFISCDHEKYPTRLALLTSRPFGLFFRGKLPEEECKAVAVVGARMCTPEGRSMAEQIAVQVVRAGGQIISGAAYGIDGAAQWAAMEAGGYSCAVLGCGVDICYPTSHTRLLERMAQAGCILSEFPPGTRPQRYHFPMRNRIISGLADAVVVVEARQKSGSLITAELAADQGKLVLAVPGRPSDSLSAGCNELIAHGAGIILSADDFVKMLFPEEKNSKKEFSDRITLAPAENLVYSSLGLHAKTLWELGEETALSWQDLSTSLLSLELKGLVKEIGQYRYLRMK